MSFQAYLDTIKAKTGKGPEDFRILAAERGLTGPALKAADVIDWLNQDFGLGRGHAMAIFSLLKQSAKPASERTETARLDVLFAGPRSRWREVHDALMQEVAGFGPDVGVSVSSSYVSVTRGGRKFAILQPTTARLDVGVKLKDEPPTARLEPAGTWNAMVTHRVRLSDAAGMDAELIHWLRRAYDKAA